MKILGATYFCNNYLESIVEEKIPFSLARKDKMSRDKGLCKDLNLKSTV